jgi:hypothetical protein
VPPASHRAPVILSAPLAPPPASDLPPAPRPTSVARAVAAVPHPVALSAPHAPPPASAAPSAPRIAPAEPPHAVPVGLETLPTSTPLHLHIIYTPSDPAEAARTDVLAKRLRSAVGTIATTDALSARATRGAVVYFFPADRAGADRIAASLAQITKRPEPVLLGHRKRLPRPGTIEIRLPRKDGKDLSNENF